MTGYQGSHKVIFKTDSHMSPRVKLFLKQVVVVQYLFDIRKQMDLKTHLTKTHYVKSPFKRAIANSSNSSSVMLPVGGTLYI